MYQWYAYSSFIMIQSQGCIIKHFIVYFIPTYIPFTNEITGDPSWHAKHKQNKAYHRKENSRTKYKTSFDGIT